VAIDAELLNQLLLSFTPGFIGIRTKAGNLIKELEYLRDQDGNVDTFRSIIYREFLQLQLLEAANLARTAPAEADALPDVAL
jgi:hypothetical protein